MSVFLLQAAQEFGDLLKQPNIRDHFEEQYPLWAGAIVNYSRKTQVRSAALQEETYRSTMMTVITLVHIHALLMCTVNVNGYCYRYACIAMSCFDIYLAERLDNESIPAIMSVVPVSLLTNMHLSLSLPFLLHIPFSFSLFRCMHSLNLF